MKPEFCEPNFCDLNINTNFTLNLGPVDKWYQMDKSLLYDHKSNHRLYTNGADDDTTSVTILLDMGSPEFVSTIKLLNTNVATGTIKLSLDGVTYTTLDTISNSASSYHYYNADSVDDYQYLITESGEYLLTEDGSKLEIEYSSLARYVLITLDTTQIPNEEKYIGELYIGRRIVKLGQGTVRSYNITNNNPKEKTVRDNLGFRSKTRVGSVYTSKWNIYGSSQDVVDFLTSLEVYGGMYELFPSPESGETIDRHLSIDSVYLIEATGNFNRNPYGTKADGVFSIDLMETRYIA